MIKNIDFIIKSGTGGYWDEDGCDLLIAHTSGLSSDIVIPRIGETVQFRDNNTDKVVYLDYLVRNVTYTYVDNHDVNIEIDILPIGHSA